MSGASAHVQAEIDKAVAHARDEAAAEAEKHAAKRIAEVCSSLPAVVLFRTWVPWSPSDGSPHDPP
jgi:regulator of protease activity HflC (stomatin/prohibitin superfamily)